MAAVQRNFMLLILLEALLALVLLLVIVWWTMFSGRNKGELPEDPKDKPPGQ
jgi:cbb3-type cytochrome oxidase subunit 3